MNPSTDSGSRELHASLYARIQSAGALAEPGSLPMSNTPQGGCEGIRVARSKPPLKLISRAQRQDDQPPVPDRPLLQVKLSVVVLLPSSRVGLSLKPLQGGGCRLRHSYGGSSVQ